MNLKNLFPIYKVEKDLIISRSGDITACFQLGLPEIFSVNEESFHELNLAWQKAMGVLPEFSLVHKQDWFITKGFEPNYEKSAASFLNHASERFFAERSQLEHTCYLFISLLNGKKGLGDSSTSNLLRKSLTPLELIKSHGMEDWLNSLAQMKVILEGGGLKIERLKAEQICGNRMESGILEKYLTLSGRGVLSDLEFRPELKVGNKFLQIFSLGEVLNLPSQVSSSLNYDVFGSEGNRFPIGFASPVSCLLPCDHIYNQYAFVGSSGKGIQKIEAKRRRMEALSLYSRENFLAEQEISKFLDESLQKGQDPIKAHFNIIAWTERFEELQVVKGLVSGALAKMNVIPKIESTGAPQLFWAGIPGNSSSLPINETFETFWGQATCFLNWETQYRDSLSPIGIRLGDRISGFPVHVDLSDTPMKLGWITNRNKFILGPSGSGKSFFTNHMIRTYLEQGAHAVLVDVGHSYQGLCELYNGYYFTYEESKPICFNPFFIDGRKLPDTEKKESLKTLLYVLWKKEGEGYRRSEYVTLSNALSGYYDVLENHPEIFPCFDTFYEYLDTEFRVVLEKQGVRERDFDVDNFMYVLRPFYKGGEFDFLLNADQNLDLLNQPFIVFELDRIKDHPILFPIVTLVIMEIFISKMRKLKGLRKIILIEEAWKAIAKEGMAEYIKYLFKTVRKFFGEAIVVTQDVEDIISSPIIKNAIINNADVKILLDQSKYRNRFEEIKKLLGLSDSETSRILSMNRARERGRNYKEVYVNIYQKVYRVEVSLEEYLTYTTEEKERMRVEEFSREYGDRKEGIRVLANLIRAEKGK